MNGLFHRPLSPPARFFALAGLGLAFGLLMSQIDAAARQVDLFVESMDFIHRPAFFLAEIMHAISHFLDDLVRSYLQVERPTISPLPNGLAVDIGALRCIPSGIVVEWTLLGALTGVAWNVWRFASWRHRFRCNLAKALRAAVGLG